MEITNYYKQELDLIDRLLRIIESGHVSRHVSRRTNKVTQLATREQLRLLRQLGIRAKWNATQQEADEMILHHKAILNSVRREPDDPAIFLLRGL